MGELKIQKSKTSLTRDNKNMRRKCKEGSIYMILCVEGELLRQVFKTLKP